MKFTQSKLFKISMIVAFTACLLFAFLLNQRDWFELCFQNRIVEDVSPVNTARKPVTPKTVLFIFDDLSEDTAERNLTRIKAKAEREGFVSTVRLDSFTFTIAGVYTLGTGDQPSLVQVKSDFLSEEAVANNIFENVRTTGKKTFHIGEALWMDNFKRGIDDSFTSRDLGLFVNYGTDKMMTQFREALKNDANGLITIHIAETGHVSHKVGIHGKPLKELHQRLETELLSLTEEFKDGVTWLVLSDHGTTVRGQHGGISERERTSFLWAFGQGIKVGKQDVISQVDITNIVAFLTGAPFTSQNCGVLPNIFDDTLQGEYRKARAELLKQKQTLYTKLKQKFGDQGAIDFNDLASLTTGVNRIKFDTSASSLLLPKILIALCLLGLLPMTFRKDISLVYLLGASVSLGTILMISDAQSWLILLICAGVLVPVVMKLDSKLLKPIAAAVAAMLVVSGIFYWFPSQIYLKQTASVRGLVLYTVIGITLIGYFAYGMLTISKKRPDSLWSPIFFGVGVGFVISTPCRYYLFIVPLGYLLLLGLGYYYQENRPLRWLRRFVVALPFLGLVIFAALCQIPDLGLTSFRKLPLYLRENSWSAELIFGAALIGYGVWINRYYQGRHRPLMRWIALAAVFCLHLVYQCKLTESNGVLIGLFAVVLSYLGVMIYKETPAHRDYWLMTLLMAFMTQQQTGAEFALVMGSTIVFRWVFKNNPYGPQSNARYIFNAFLIIVYFVHFLGVQGQLFSPNHFMILKGFVGFRMPLNLPVSVSLIVFYYLQPIMLSWLTIRITLPSNTPPILFNTAIVTSTLFLLQAVFTNTLFSYSLCPGDTYIKTSAGTVIIMAYAFGLTILAAIARVVTIIRGDYAEGE